MEQTFEDFLDYLNRMEIEIPEPTAKRIFTLWKNSNIPFPEDALENIANGKSFSIFSQCSKCSNPVNLGDSHCSSYQELKYSYSIKESLILEKFNIRKTNIKFREKDNHTLK